MGQLLATQPEAPHIAAMADAMGDPDKSWVVYAVGQGHRKATAGQLLDEARARARVTDWSEVKRRKGAPVD